jgi:hypothetical protein
MKKNNLENLFVPDVFIVCPVPQLRDAAAASLLLTFPIRMNVCFKTQNMQSEY